MFQKATRVANYHHSHDTVSFSFFACTVLECLTDPSDLLGLITKG